MKKFTIAILTMCISALALAQSPGEIKGKVFDAKTKHAVAGATVFVKQMGNIIATVVENSGDFTLKPLDPGTYNVRVVFLGYDTAKFDGVQVNSDKMTFLDTAYMSTGINIIHTWTVSGVRLIEPDAPGKISIPRKEIEGMPNPGKINEVLRSMLSDVNVSDDGKEIYFRGSRNGDAVYYVDGVKLRDNQLHIPGLAIGSMTVYTGGVPAKYGDFTGGVVVVETQSYFSWLNEKNSSSNTK